MKQRVWTILLVLIAASLVVTGCGKSASEIELEKREARIAELEEELKDRDETILSLTAQVNSFKVKDVSEEAEQLARERTEFEARKRNYEQQLLDLSAKAGELKNKNDHLADMARKRDEADAFSKSFITWVCVALGALVLIGTVAFFLIRWDSSRKEVVLQDRRNRLLLLRDLADRLLDAMKTGAAPDAIEAFGRSAREIREGIAQIDPNTPKGLPEDDAGDKSA